MSAPFENFSIKYVGENVFKVHCSIPPETVAASETRIRQCWEFIQQAIKEKIEKERP